MMEKPDVVTDDYCEHDVLYRKVYNGLLFYYCPQCDGLICNLLSVSKVLSRRSIADDMAVLELKDRDVGSYYYG